MKATESEELLEEESLVLEIEPYLPTLKNKFFKEIGELSSFEKAFTEKAFVNYEAYFEFVKNKGENLNKKVVSKEYMINCLKEIENSYENITQKIQNGIFIEVDEELLKDIFKYYKELISITALHFIGSYKKA